MENLKNYKFKESVLKQIKKNSELVGKLGKIAENFKFDPLSDLQSKLIYELVVLGKDLEEQGQFKLVDYIIKGGVQKKIQITEGIRFLESGEVDDFENKIGIGFDCTDEDIKKYVGDYFTKHEEDIKKNPFDKKLMTDLRDGLKFADQKVLIGEYNTLVKPFKGKKVKKVKKKVEKKKERTDQDLDQLVKKYDITKLVARDLKGTKNDEKTLQAHKMRTKGAIITRFPPEPNGYLHIGHCKAIRFNFKLAADQGGYTNLRYDDTNPQKETQEYIDKILENVKWMGYKPKNIFFASDYFHQIYDHAITLIKKGKAFTCKLSKEEGKIVREKKEPSPYRNQSIEQNLKEFALMKSGFYAEGEIVLRAKIDFANNNTTLRDPPIYRVMYVPHPHKGDEWCIYPLYDFVHCISDSIEDITHSCCTLEFEIRRDLYYWFLNELDLYKPFVWEYSRLNLSQNVLSKRKLIKMVEQNLVDGWDDPRLLSIAGIKRRGYPAEAINYFCDLISVSRSGNDKQLDIGVLEYVMRKYLMKNAKHALAVIEPFELELVNHKKDIVIDNKENNVKHPMVINKIIYVDKNDVQEQDSPKFWGIAPGKIVRLRYGPFVKILEVNKNKATGEIMEDNDIADFKKVKGILHWVGKEDSIQVEVRKYERLFSDPFPGRRTGNFLDDYDKDSKIIYKNSRISKGHAKVIEKDSRWQFERKGYYFVDYDSDIEKNKFVFNMIVNLKQSKLKLDI